MTFSKEDTSPQLNVRVTEETMDRLETLCTDYGDKSEHVRAALTEYLDRQLGGREAPADPQLERAYRTLVRMTGGDGGYVRHERAVNQLAQTFSMDTGSVFASVIRPLIKQGYLGKAATWDQSTTSYEVRV